MWRRFLPALDARDFEAEERVQLARLMSVLVDRDPPPDAGEFFPRYGEFRDQVLVALERGQVEAVEESFLSLYAHLHMHEAPYTRSERRSVDASGGYWCHAGGLAPILRSPSFISPDSTSCDLGAGNGLQLLLVHKLAPHRLAIQIEISSRMLEIGRVVQEWLDIEDSRVEWHSGDLMELPLPKADFLYLYRPMKPDGPGTEFYRRLAAHLENLEQPPVIFSIADCLWDFLGPKFELVSSNGHLTIIRRHDER